LDSHGRAATHAAVTTPTVTVDEPPPAGRFAYTTQHRNRPRTLSTWQLTTSDPRLAAQIARLLGGQPDQQPAGHVQLVTGTATLPILVDGPAAVRIRWLPGPDRACDGHAQDDGRPCACPAAFALRRAAAKRGHGCQPTIEVRFRLQGAAALGGFAFMSMDWSFVELAAEARARLDAAGQPVTARLDLYRTLYALRSGRELAYTRPMLVLHESR